MMAAALVVTVALAVVGLAVLVAGGVRGWSRSRARARVAAAVRWRMWEGVLSG